MRICGTYLDEGGHDVEDGHLFRERLDLRVGAQNICHDVADVVVGVMSLVQQTGEIGPQGEPRGRLSGGRRSCHAGPDRVDEALQDLVCHAIRGRVPWVQLPAGRNEAAGDAHAAGALARLFIGIAAHEAQLQSGVLGPQMGILALQETDPLLQHAEAPVSKRELVGQRRDLLAQGGDGPLVAVSHGLLRLAVPGTFALQLQLALRRAHGAA